MNEFIPVSSRSSLPSASATSGQPTSHPVPSGAKPAHVFLFLELFAREGGIQSYVQDIFQSYLILSESASQAGLADLCQPSLPAQVFLLRDHPDSANPFQGDVLQFHYFKTAAIRWDRLKLAIALLVYLVRHRPRRVFCGHVNLAPLVGLLCKPLGIPYTVLTYGKEVWHPLPVPLRWSLQQADTIWTISRYSRDQACAANQLDPHKVRLLPCAVDGERFTPGTKSPDLIQKYGLAGSQVLLTVARLWSGDIYKGVDITIRALPTIAAAVPEVKYLVIGRGDDQPRLARLAAELGVADRVVFAGFVPTAELVEHYRLADAYVMPSQEGFGIVYLEAMACGVPVVSGDADGSAEPLQDGRLGWRVPHRDPDAVAAACITILQGRAAQEQGVAYDQRCDGSWLRQQVLQCFGKPAFTQQLQHLLLGNGSTEYQGWELVN